VANPLKGKKRPTALCDWGTSTAKVGAAKKKVKVYARMAKATITALGLKEYKAKPVLKKDKKGRGRIALATGGASIAKHVSGHYLRVSTGKMGKKGKSGTQSPLFIRVKVPASLSLSQAAITIQKAGKAKLIKFPGGETFDFSGK